MFWSRVLRRIFGPEMEDGTAALRKFSNEDVYSLFSLTNIIRPIKSRSMR
jgi:hypothetical protein